MCSIILDSGFKKLYNALKESSEIEIFKLVVKYMLVYKKSRINFILILGALSQLKETLYQNDKLPKKNSVNEMFFKLVLYIVLKIHYH